MRKHIRKYLLSANLYSHKQPTGTGLHLDRQNVNINKGRDMTGKNEYVTALASI